MVLSGLDGAVDLGQGQEVVMRGILAIRAQPRHDARKVDAHIGGQQQVGPPWLDLQAEQQRPSTLFRRTHECCMHAT